jgi:hypothetical protein
MEGRYKGYLDEPVQSMIPLHDLPPNSLLVDIGGGNGQHAISLASLYPQLNCLIQDHSSVVSAARENIVLPDDIKTRVSWEAHDYFLPQPRKAADIYLLSHVLMDNTERCGNSVHYYIPTNIPSDCVRILREIVKAMDAESSRILIHDYMDPLSYDIDRPRRFDMLDLHLLANLNKPSRSDADWDQLIKITSDRLIKHKTWVGKEGNVIFELRIKNK